MSSDNMAIPPEINGGDASDQLRADLRTLRDDLDRLAGDVAALGRNQVQRARDGAVDFAQAGEEAVRDMDATLSSAVREKPLRALGLAFFAGYVFSALSR